MGRKPTCICGECRKCRHRVTARAHYAKNAEEIRQRSRESRLRRIEAVRAYDRERGYREYDPLKAKARRAVNHAIFAGRLKQEPCEVCGESKVDGHHDDYSKPLEARWLCRTHHMELHRRIAG